jgi:hypothetical protein
MDDVVADLTVMKIKQWTENMKDTQQWRLTVVEAKAQPGLWRQDRGRKESNYIMSCASFLI